MRALLIAFLLVNAAFAGDSNSFQPHQVLSFTNLSKGLVITNGYGTRVLIRHPLLDPSKAANITNGITLGQIVTILGPGWMSQGESVGIIRWNFLDGRELDVLPASFSASDVISSDIGARSHFWFETNILYGPKQ